MGFLFPLARRKCREEGSESRSKKIGEGDFIPEQNSITDFNFFFKNTHDIKIKTFCKGSLDGWIINPIIFVFLTQRLLMSELIVNCIHGCSSCGSFFFIFVYFQSSFIQIGGNQIT